MRSWFLLIITAGLACSAEATPSGGASGASGDSTTSGSSQASGAGGFSGASSGSTGGGGAAVDDDASDGSQQAREACSSFASALCSKLETCTSFVLGVLYGDAPTCKARVMLSCLPSFGATGTSATPAKTMACEQSIAALACPAFLSGELGPGCKTEPGMVPAGGPCGDDAQCATTFCARAPDATCGVCQTPTQAGQPCVRGSCSAGTVCPAGQSTCITPTPGKVGDACTAQEQCDLAHAVGCNTGAGKCLALTLAAPQGTCGANSIVPTSYAVCPSSGTCSALLGGKCSGAADDDGSCSAADSGPHCLPPARCVTGKCTVPDPAACR